MKITYFNDSNKEVILRVPPDVKKILPGKVVQFSVDVPENKRLFVKQWNNGTILFSFIEKL